MADKKRFLLRIDPEVYRALNRWADDEFRSVNGQIEFLLTAAVKKAGRLRGGGDLDAEPRDSGDADSDVDSDVDSDADSAV